MIAPILEVLAGLIIAGAISLGLIAVTRLWLLWLLGKWQDSDDNDL